MDSLTQFALGAAVGEAMLGRKFGYNAILLGGLAGTIPDLDVFVANLFNELDGMRIHRGFSHSIFFGLIFGPILGWLSSKISNKVSFKRWSLFWFLAFFTHTFIDCCTTYGTQLFNPISDKLITFSNIFVVDPLYTLPLLVGLIVALFLHRNSDARRLANYAGILLSTVYMLWTFIAKDIADRHFAAELNRQGIEYSRLHSTPTILNSFLWEGVAQTEEGTYFGTYSVFDKKEEIDFRYLDTNHALIEPYEKTREIETAMWFSTGLYAVRQIGEEIHVYTTKFGPMNLEGPIEFIFPMILKPTGKNSLEYLGNGPDPNFDEMQEGLWLLWDRVWGL